MHVAYRDGQGVGGIGRQCGGMVREQKLQRRKLRLQSFVVDFGMAVDNGTNGYWMAAADGGIFTFGGATYFGRVVSTAG